MRAAVFKGAGQPLAIETLPDPRPAPGQVLVKICRCGICGTDLHLTSEHGAGLQVGGQLGHEYAGEVVDLGPAADGSLKVGDKVAVMPVAGCGRCGACLAGEPMSCAQSTQQTVGFGEYAAVGQTSARKLPDSLSLADGALVEPLGVGLHGVVLADLKPGARVLVLGAGSVGLAVIFWARKLGAGRIVASSPSARRADLAASMGADGFVTMGAEESERINAALGGPPDVVFECVGAAGLLGKSIELARTGGTIVSLGFCTAPDPVLPALATLKQVTIKFSFTYTLAEFVYSAQALDKGQVEPRLMISKTVSLEAFPAELEALRRGAPQTKVHVDPWMN